MLINFKEFDFRFDQWHGEIEAPSSQGKFTIIKVSMRGDSTEISQKQKESIVSFISYFEKYWEVMSRTIEERNNGIEYELDEEITLAAPGLVSSYGVAKTYEYIVGHKVYCKGIYLRMT